MPAGRPRNIDSPETMLKLWEAYKAEVDAKPDIQQIATGKGVFDIKVKRPYLRQGFQAYCFRNGYGVIEQYIKNQDNLYAEFIPVVTHIRSEWEGDQIEGSLTGRYKAPNLVARLNGLTDKQETENKGIQKIIVEYSESNITGTTSRADTNP